MTSLGTTTDVVIIGGGPAGLSAGMWCKELGLNAIIAEQSPEIGGQLLSVYNPINNYLGVSARDGREMVSHFRRTMESSGFDRIVFSGVELIDAVRKVVVPSNGLELQWRALIIATGVRRRRLHVPGEDSLQGKGIIGSGVRDKGLVRDKRVLVVGGGDAAFENALSLSDTAHSVKVAYRRAMPTARKNFVDAVTARRNVDLLSQTLVSGIEGESAVSSVKLMDISKGEEWSEPFDIVLIRIGVEPNSELVKDAVDLDDRGYINVNSSCETSRSGIFAVGDVAHPGSPTISTAAGSGATAAKTVYRFLTEPKQV